MSPLPLRDCTTYALIAQHNKQKEKKKMSTPWLSVPYPFGKALSSGPLDPGSNPPADTQSPGVLPESSSTRPPESEPTPGQI